MNKKWPILLILTVILIGTILYIRFYVTENNHWALNLNTGKSYATIQEAINANETKNGHSILVGEDVYHENIVVNKALSLLGKNAATTIIDGKNVTNGIEFTVDNSSLTGFTIKNYNPFYGGYALTLTNIKNCTINGNSFENNYYGIRLYSCFNISIFENNFVNNNVGVLLTSSSNNNMSENYLTNCQYGFELLSSKNNTLARNKMIENGKGIALSISSNNNTLIENNIEENTWGIEMGASTNNKVYHNNFTDNTHQVFYGAYSYVNIWDNGYLSGGNYWSDYNGADANGDGIGDTSYQMNANNTDNYPLTTPYLIP